MRASLIILAGGSGKRFAGPTKKQYVKIGEEYLLSITLAKFVDIQAIFERILVVSEDDKEFLNREFSEELKKYKINKVVTGGSERVYSVINGLLAVQNDADLIVIHDSVRPFIEQGTIYETIKCAELTGAAIAATPVQDTLKKASVNDGELRILETVERSGLWAAGTPQVFSKKLFEKAVQNWKNIGEPSVTDDAMLIELLGEKVSIVKSSKLNIKITQPEDIILANAIFIGQKK